MNESNSESLKKLVARLETERDEIRVKAHLAKLELDDEWQSIESRWENLEHRVASIADSTKETGETFIAASQLLAEELSEAVANFRANLK